MSDPFLFSISVFGLFSSTIAIHYIIRVAGSFTGLSRLYRPWLLLGLGVVSLFLAVLTSPLTELIPTFAYSHLVQTVAVVVAAFLVLTAMVTMKQAWTIKETD